MVFRLSSALPLLVFVLVFLACWILFVDDDGEDREEPTGAPGCEETCRLYGASQPTRGSPEAARSPEGRYADELRRGSELEAASNFMKPSQKCSPEETPTKHGGASPGHPDASMDRTSEEEAWKRKQEFHAVAEDVLRQSTEAAQIKPPTMEAMEELLPARVWTPVFEGCSSQFVDASCRHYKENPRLYVTDMNELLSARNMLSGRENLLEPKTLRQTHAQFLTMGWRSKKDPYSKASMTNNVAYSTCRSMKENDPDYVVF
jgi:hypothetical protein